MSIHYITIKMDKINHYVAKMTFRVGNVSVEEIKKAKNTDETANPTAKRSKIHAKFTKMQANFNTYEKRP